MSTETTPNGNTRAADGDVSSFVRERRRSRGWTQQELADYVGVGRRFIVELEAGKTTVRLDAVQRVVRLFGKRIGVVDDVD